MTRQFSWLLVVLLAGTATMAIAQRPSETPPLDSELPALQLLQRTGPEATPQQQLAALEQALTMLSQPTAFRGSVLCQRGVVLRMLERAKESRRALEDCRALRPNDPMVLLLLGFAEVEERRPVEGAMLFLRSIEIDPDAIRQIEPMVMDTMFRQLAYARADVIRDRLTEALAKSGWARNNPVRFSKMAYGAMRRRVIAGDTAGALTFLPSILSPSTGVSMLIDRRFAPIWPQIEAWAGRDLEVQRRALSEHARATYAVTRSSSDWLEYIQALDDSGAKTDAIAQLRQLLTSPTEDVDAYDRSIAIIRLGRLLGETGNRAEGIAALRRGIADPALKDEAGNIVPNLVVQLITAQDYDAALQVLDRDTPAEEKMEASAAFGYFVALRACALKGLGRQAAAETALRRVQATYANNDNAVSYAVNCVGTPDERAANWLRQVGGDGTSDALIALASAIQRAKLGLPIESVGDAALRSIADRQDVLAAYQRYGRTLPEGYLSALVEFAESPKPPSVPVSIR